MFLHLSERLIGKLPQAFTPSNQKVVTRGYLKGRCTATEHQLITPRYIYQKAGPFGANLSRAVAKTKHREARVNAKKETEGCYDRKFAPLMSSIASRPPLESERDNTGTREAAAPCHGGQGEKISGGVKLSASLPRFNEP